MITTLDTSSFVNILRSGGLFLFNEIFKNYEKVRITDNIKKELISNLNKNILSPTERKKVIDLINHTFEIISIESQEVKSFLKTENQYLSSLGKKISALSYADAEGLLLTKKGYTDLYITDDVSCWIVAKKNDIVYSSSLYEFYKLFLYDKIRFIEMVKYSSILFSSSGWRPIRGYHAEVAMNEYFKIIEKATILSKDKIRDSILKSETKLITGTTLMRLISDILGCESR